MRFIVRWASIAERVSRWYRDDCNSTLGNVRLNLPESFFSIGLATRWLRILSLGGTDIIRNHLVAKLDIERNKSKFSCAYETLVAIRAFVCTISLFVLFSFACCLALSYFVEGSSNYLNSSSFTCYEFLELKKENLNDRLAIRNDPIVFGKTYTRYHNFSCFNLWRGN